VFYDTLLGIIPNELLDIININIKEIIIARNESVIESHKKYHLTTHLLCHICKLNEATFNLRKLCGKYGAHACCSYCISHKLYTKCDGCLEFINNLYLTHHQHYVEKPKNDKDLLIRM